MRRLGSILPMVPVMLLVAGCTVGYNSTLFLTQSNIGLDVETKPPSAEVSISRREGVLEPAFEGGQTPPVMAGFRNTSNPISRLLFGVQSTFAGGDAALALSQGSGGAIAGHDSALCLSKAPDPQHHLAWDVSVPKKGSTVPLFFTTDAILGLRAAWTGAAGPSPDSLQLGFNRKEAAWAPIFGTDAATCKIPGTNQAGSYVVWMPSFLASLEARTQVGKPSETGVTWIEYFATGNSATALANRDDVRAVVLNQTFPAVNAGAFDYTDPSAACILNWLGSPENGAALRQWWSEQNIPGNAGLAMMQHQYASQRAAFIKQKNILCK
jgi:hypothetical protein